jgi:GNAT superfamily N-acetyltransferase
MTVSVSQATDGGQVAELLATAFAEDPILCWLLGDRNAQEARRKLFEQTLHIFMRDGLVEITEDGGSAAVWGLPHPVKRNRILRAIDAARMALVTLVATGGATSNRAVRLAETLRSHHPQGPHFYLAAIGTLPEARGKGGASGLLATRLEVCDREGVEAYLESSSANNLPLYERHGFEILRQINVGDSPPLWLMTRPPHRPRFE